MHSTAGVCVRGAPGQALPKELRSQLVAQRHEEYGADAHRAWREALQRNEWLLSSWGSRVHPAYEEGIRALDLPKSVPRMEEINERLAPTGWQVVCVDGYVPSSIYAGLMEARLFPMSRRMRRPEHVDYAPEPDLVHDVIGHLPMLFSPQHREFLQNLAAVMVRAHASELDDELYAANRSLGEVMSQAAPSLEAAHEAHARVTRVREALDTNASQLTHLARMYLWSVEFGLTGTREEIVIHGAALLSSPTEITALCEGRSTVLPYSIDVIHSDVAFTELQKQYFVARDFAHFQQVLCRYEGRMDGSGPRRIDGRGGRNA